MMKKALLAALAAALTTPALLAGAPDNPLAKEKVVLRLDRLDFATVEGQRALAIRIDEAAREVCGDRVATIHLALGEQSRSCQARVKADVAARIEGRIAATGRASTGSVRLAAR